MSGVLHQARILSSETDNTIKQEQNTNVNINIAHRAAAKSLKEPHQRCASTHPTTNSSSPNVNFTELQNNVPQINGSSQNGQDIQPIHSKDLIPTADMNESLTPDLGHLASPSQLPIDKPFPLTQERGLVDLSIELDSLEKKNRFLEMIVQMYEGNPLKINSYVVCNSKLLMDMIKLLTECDKVELVIDDSDTGCNCTIKPSKFIKVAKILVTKDGKTEDMKYAYNDIYSQFIKYGVSLKIVT